jgi:hypothetical protein
VAPKAGAVIASRTGLAALAALAIAFAAIVAWDVRSAHEWREEGALLPGFDGAQVAEIRWSGGPPAGVLAPVLRRSGSEPDRSGGWVLCLDPACQHHLRADTARVDEIVAAVRGGRWHRQAPPGTAGPIEQTLELRVRDGATTFVGKGRALAGLDQRWLLVDRTGTGGRTALLVDGWIARALFPESIELAVRFPLASAHAAHTIELPGQLHLEGHPRKRGKLWVDPVRVEALERALEALELKALPRHEIAARSRVRLDGGAFAVGPGVEQDACPGGDLALWSVTGSGCIDAERWAAVARAVDQLVGPDAEVADPRVAPIMNEVIASSGCAGGRSNAERCAGTIELSDHHKLSLHGRPQVDGHDADPDRVAELVQALVAKAVVVAPPTDPPRATLAIASQDDTCHLDVHRDGVVVRREDGIALKLAAAGAAMLARDGDVYRDPTRWLEEPTTITSISVDGAVYRRGAVVGEWPGAKDASLVEALATAAAVVRAPSGPAPSSIRHRIDLTITPPVGAPSIHRLEVGDPSPSGCAGRADGQPVLLSLALCTAAMAAAP